MNMPKTFTEPSNVRTSRVVPIKKTRDIIYLLTASALYPNGITFLETMEQDVLTVNCHRGWLFVIKFVITGLGLVSL